VNKHNVGLVVCFIGTDGSGKSTIIESIKPFLKKKFNHGVYYEHMRPNKFPSIASIFGKLESVQGSVVDPHSSPPSGFLGSLIRWAYYMLDYTLGFHIKVAPKVKAGSCIWIFDRYYYDYLIDPLRSRVKLPKSFLKFGQFIIPEPDIIICLGTDPEIIHKRKPELPFGEVKRQVKELKMFCANHESSIWIDTSKSINASSIEVFEVIMLCYINKMKQV
jgi:thymidylate kinase